MQKTDLLKKMLPGLLPILFFIIADEVWGTEEGLIVAIIIGFIQLIYFRIKEKRIEKFVLTDTLLIIAMGGVSIFLDNDIFFKLKPAIIESILIAVLAFSLFSKHNIMLNMSKRYIKGVEINDEQDKILRKSIRNLLIILTAHLLLTIYASFYLNEKAWAFISTVLFYCMIGAYFGIDILLKYIKNKKTEYLPILDKNENIIGKASREECHKNPNLIFPVVRLHLFNSKGEILLQRRSLKSDIEPGKWDAAVAGHIKFGENAENTITRECNEELNTEINNYQLLNKRIFKAKTSTALMLVFVGLIDELPNANPKEVEEVSFFNINELQPLITKNKTSKGIVQEYNLLRQIKVSQIK